jgi:hypothetical protein
MELFDNALLRKTRRASPALVNPENKYDSQYFLFLLLQWASSSGSFRSLQSVPWDEDGDA